MDALSNATTIRRGGINPLCAGSAPNALPEAIDSQGGVSVRYAPDPNKHWFVLRATHNRAYQAYRHLLDDGIEAYLPMKMILRTVQGKKVKSTEPLLPNLLFVYASKEWLDRYVKETHALPYLNYYYDHFKTLDNGKNPPLTVGYDDMINFINLTNIDNYHIRLVKPGQCHFKGGDEVRITSGQFKGIRGKVARVAGQQRVVVTIKGICLVATAYIPTDFIEYI